MADPRVGVEVDEVDLNLDSEIKAMDKHNKVKEPNGNEIEEGDESGRVLTNPTTESDVLKAEVIDKLETEREDDPKL